jgi:rhodanese-related sulfurtransferase
MKITTLNNGAFLLFGLIMAGLFFNALGSKNYSRSNAAVLESSLGEDFFISYGELQDMLSPDKGTMHDKGAGNGKEGNIFLDLRDPEAFAEGHFPGALNIPAGEILDRRHRRLFKNKSLKLVYAGEEHVAAAAAMLLLGKGAENIRVIPGGFQDLQKNLLRSGAPDPSYRFYRDDKARFDYPRFMKGSPGQSPDEKSTPAIPEMQTQVISVQGGC